MNGNSGPQDHGDGLDRQEHKEVPLVLLSDAVPDPGAVVVEMLDTPVANGAVLRSQRPHNLQKTGDVISAGQYTAEALRSLYQTVD